MNALESMAQAWWGWVAALSWQLTFFVGLVALATLATRRLSARLRYGLWLLIVLKAILPPTLGAGWAVGQWGMAPLERHVKAILPGTVSVAPGPDGFSEAVLEEEAPHTTATASDVALTADIPPVQSIATFPIVPARNRFLPPTVWLFGIWIVGMFVFLGIVFTRYRILLHRLARAEQVEEGPLRFELESLAMVLGCREAPELWLSDHMPQPFLIGLRRPRIILPRELAQTLSPEGLRYVLTHELMHWRRRDLISGWLWLAVQAVFWFHPLVWLAGVRLRHERECACDEAVLAVEGTETRSYGESLLSVLLTSRGKAAMAVGLLGIFERHSLIQERLEEIMHYETRKKAFSWWQGLMIGLFAVIFLPMASCQTLSSARDTAIEPGTSAAKAEYLQVLRQKVTLVMEKSSDGSPLTVQYGVMAICKQIGVPYQWEKSAKLADPERRRFIGPLDVKGARAADALSKIVQPVGLQWGLDDNGLYLTRIISTEAPGAAMGYPQALKNRTVTLDLEKSPDGSPLTVQYAAMAICKEVGVPFDWEKSARMADPERRKFIEPIKLKDAQADEALTKILKPVGLQYGLNDNGLYLARLGGPSTAVSFDDVLQNTKITLALVKTSPKSTLTVDYAVRAICKEAGIPVFGQKSAQLTGSDLRRFIEPITFQDVPAGEALAKILEPVGLQYDLAPQGLYVMPTKAFEQRILGQWLEVGKTGASVLIFNQDHTWASLESGQPKDKGGWSVKSGAYYLEDRDLVGRFSFAGRLVFIHPRQPDGEKLTFERDQEGAPPEEPGSAQTPAQGGESSRASSEPEALSAQLTLKHDDGKADSNQSFTAKDWCVVGFGRPAEGYNLAAVEIFAGRYGEPDSANETFDIYVLDGQMKVLQVTSRPRGIFEQGEDKMRWVQIPIDPVAVPEKFFIAVAPKDQKEKGLFMGIDRQAEDFSLRGDPVNGFKPFSSRKMAIVKDGRWVDVPAVGGWMIRAQISNAGLSQRSELPSRPRVIATSPGMGATDVDPGLRQITMTFDGDMNTQCIPRPDGDKDAPKSPASQSPFWRDARTWVFPVALQAGQYYRLDFNSCTGQMGFEDASGTKAIPDELSFCTLGATNEVKQRVLAPVSAQQASEAVVEGQ